MYLILRATGLNNGINFRMTTNYSTQEVSVLIPAYNAESTIQRAVDSVLCGTKLPKEIIVYNDASLDGTLSTLKKLYGDIDLVTIISSEQNYGAGVARSRLLEVATGSLIAFLDADDEWAETKLQKQVDQINVEKADICICGYEVYNDNQKHIGSRVPPMKINFFSMHLANWIPTSMVVFRAGLKNSRRMSSLRQRQDYAFWLRLIGTNPGIKISVINECLGKYHRQRDSLSSRKLRNLKLNYLVFRTEARYSAIFSGFLVMVNIFVRLTRA